MKKLIIAVVILLLNNEIIALLGLLVLTASAVWRMLCEAGERG